MQMLSDEEKKLLFQEAAKASKNNFNSKITRISHQNSQSSINSRFWSFTLYKKQPR
jgi:hypothetical protein